MGSNFNAFSRGGLGHWRASRQLNQVASELAFHRSRVARGIKHSDAHEREAAYQMALRDLLTSFVSASRASIDQEHGRFKSLASFITVRLY